MLLMLSVGCHKAACGVGELAIASEVKVSKSFINFLPELKFSPGLRKSVWERGLKCFIFCEDFSVLPLKRNYKVRDFCFLQCSS